MAASIARSMELFRKKDRAEIRSYGNKIPIYSHFYDRVMGELETPRAIMMHRDPLDCAKSYQSRSQNPKDSWPEGRTAVFAAIEMLHLVKAIDATPHKSALVVPQALLKADWKPVFEAASAYLLPGVDYTIDAEIIDSVEAGKSRRSGRPVVEIPEHEMEIIRELLPEGISEIFPTDRVTTIEAEQERIREIAARIPDDYIDVVGRRIAESLPEAARRHFEVWKTKIVQAE